MNLPNLYGRILYSLPSESEEPRESLFDLIKEAIRQALTPEYGEYEHLGLTELSLEKIRIAVIAFFIAVIAATYFAVFNRSVYGRLITRLNAEGCFSPEAAKTLKELGLERNPSVRSSLRRGSTYRGLVRCVEKDAFDVEAERERRQLAEDGVAVKRKNYVFNFETDRFYVPEDKAFEAETRFQKKIPGWPIVLIVTVAGLAALAGAIFLLPDIIQFIDNFAGKMGF